MVVMRSCNIIAVVYVWLRCQNIYYISIPQRIITDYAWARARRDAA